MLGKCSWLSQIQPKRNCPNELYLRYNQFCGGGVHVDISTHRQEGVKCERASRRFNQEKALVGAFSVIVQLHRLIDLRH